MSETGRQFIPLYFDVVTSKLYSQVSGEALKLYFLLRRYVCRARTEHKLSAFYIGGALAVSGYLGQYAKHFGVSEATISRRIAELEDHKLLVTYQKGREGVPSVWILGKVSHIEGSQWGVEAFFLDHEATAQELDPQVEITFDPQWLEEHVWPRMGNLNSTLALLQVQMQVQMQGSNREDIIEKTNRSPSSNDDGTLKERENEPCTSTGESGGWNHGLDRGTGGNKSEHSEEGSSPRKKEGTNELSRVGMAGTGGGESTGSREQTCGGTGSDSTVASRESKSGSPAKQAQERLRPVEHQGEKPGTSVVHRLLNSTITRGEGDPIQRSDLAQYIGQQLGSLVPAGGLGKLAMGYTEQLPGGIQIHHLSPDELWKSEPQYSTYVQERLRYWKGQSGSPAARRSKVINQLCSYKGSPYSWLEWRGKNDDSEDKYAASQN